MSALPSSTGLPPSALRREIRLLMNQQLWCWGCDIRHHQENLLIAHGARRVPPRVPSDSRSAAYHVALDGGGWLMLWGFGVACVPSPGLSVLLPRYDPTPRTVADAEALRQVWCLQDLPPHEAAGRQLPAWWSALKALRWMAAYEQWVVARAGAGWRRECAARFEASEVTGDQLGRAWTDVCERLSQTTMRAALGRREAHANARRLVS